MNTGLAGHQDVEVVVAIDVGYDELRPRARRAVVTGGVAREGGIAAIDLVVVDGQRLIGTGVVAVVPAVTLDGEQFQLAVAVKVGQGQDVYLRERVVNQVGVPGALTVLCGLLQPIEAVAVAMPIDQVHLSIIVDVKPEYGETAVA